MVKKRKSRSKGSRKSSSLHLKTSTSTKSSDFQDALNYDNESWIRQIDNLNQKIQRLQYAIDCFEVCSKDVSEHINAEEFDKTYLSSYLKECIFRKEAEITDYNRQLEQLELSITKKHNEHEEYVARILLETEAIVERLGSEKATLAGKIAAMEESRVQRDQLNTKFEEINRALDDTFAQNRRDYHGKDLEITVEQKRLYDEMKQRCLHLAYEFRVASQQRLAQSQHRTMKTNCTLTKQLSTLGEQTMTLLSQTRSHELATTELKRDVDLMTEVSQKMQNKFRTQIKILDDTISSCKAKENELLDLSQSLDVGSNSRDINSTADSVNMTELQLGRERLASDLNDKRKQLSIAKTEYNDLGELMTETAYQFRKMVTSHISLSELVYDTEKALTEALELFNPHSLLNFTEQNERRDHLLAALFVLLYTSDRISERITPQSLGASRLHREVQPNYCTQSNNDIPSASLTGSAIPKSQTDVSQTNTLSKDLDVSRNIKPEKSWTSLVITPSKLFEFGLIPVDSRHSSYKSATFLRNLSATSRGLNQHMTSQATLYSIGVQTGGQNTTSGINGTIKNKSHINFSINNTLGHLNAVSQYGASGALPRINSLPTEPSLRTMRNAPKDVYRFPVPPRQVSFDSAFKAQLPSLNSLASI